MRRKWAKNSSSSFSPYAVLFRPAAACSRRPRFSLGGRRRLYLFFYFIKMHRAIVTEEEEEAVTTLSTTTTTIELAVVRVCVCGS